MLTTDSLQEVIIRIYDNFTTILTSHSFAKNKVNCCITLLISKTELKLIETQNNFQEIFF